MSIGLIDNKTTTLVRLLRDVRPFAVPQGNKRRPIQNLAAENQGSFKEIKPGMTSFGF